jgi:general secretion pathway protein G
MNRPNEGGFTLIEIMVVIIIMGILASVVAVNVIGRVEEARRTKATMQIGNFGSALALYKLDNGSYPSTEQGLNAIIEAPTVGTLPRKWREGGYLEKKKIPLDPWKNEYVYISPGLHGDYDLSSYGNDNAPGGEKDDADVNSWDVEE